MVPVACKYHHISLQIPPHLTANATTSYMQELQERHVNLIPGNMLQVCLRVNYPKALTGSEGSDAKSEITPTGGRATTQAAMQEVLRKQ